MDLRQKAMDAYKAYEEKEETRLAKGEAESRQKVVDGLAEQMREFFGETIDFCIIAKDNVYAMMPELDGVVFSVHWHYGYELDAAYNGTKSRMWDWHSLGALLLTPEPKEPKKEELASEPSPTVEKRFDVVSVDDANVKYREGREFLVHTAVSDEYGNTLTIEYTDLWRIEQAEMDDEDLPF